MNRSVVRGLLLVVVLLLLLLAAGAGFAWWKINGLKQQLVLNLESSLGARVQVASLGLDAWKGEIHAAGISLVNQRPDAPWDTAEIDQAIGRFRLMDLLSPTLPLQVEVSGWKIGLHTAVAVTAPVDNAASMPSDSTPSAPDRVRVTALAARGGEVVLRLSPGDVLMVHGVIFHATTHGGSDWTTELQCSSLTAGTLVTGSGSVHLQSDDRQVAFTDLAIHCDAGLIAGGGEAGLTGKHSLHGTFQATSVPITMLVAARWQMKLSGLVSGDLAVQGDDASATAHGKFSVAGGHFNVLPWLGKVTTLVGLADVTGVEFDQATSDFSWKNHALTLSNIDVRKNGVLRIAGQVDVAATGECDGRLKLGLPSTVTARWPKLQAEVFSAPFEDDNWADVHLTGTPEDLHEDLTPRLLAVGAEQGEDLIKQSTQKASDFLNSLLK